MPELAFGYLVGFIITALLVALHVFLQIQKQKSTSMRLVQSNLKKINLFWSESESSIKKYEVDGEKKDFDKCIKSILISGFGFMFLSWLGFLFQFILMLSLRYLAVKRVETNLFESALSKQEHDIPAIQQLVSML